VLVQLVEQGELAVQQRLELLVEPEAQVVLVVLDMQAVLLLLTLLEI
jgi:hypothetical protein